MGNRFVHAVAPTAVALAWARETERRNPHAVPQVAGTDAEELDQGDFIETSLTRNGRHGRTVKRAECQNDDEPPSGSRGDACSVSGKE